jgi:hypothetical protein
MKSPILFVALAAISAVPAGAAGLSAKELLRLYNDRVGNGGFAHVCRDSSGAITSARLLDLWEADSLKPLASDRPVETQVEEALAKLKAFSPNAYGAVSNRYDALKGAVVKTPRALSKTEDAFPPYEPSAGCAYEQVARFEPVLTETGTSGLRINSEIYDHPSFTNSDRAALFVHEAVYLVDRLRNGAKNSQRSRTLTGHLVSESPVPDAVRMLFLYLIATDKLHDDGEDSVPIFALPDPLAIQARLARIYSIEGISYDGSTPEQRKAEYRCAIGPTFPRKYETRADSGYRPLAELVSYQKPVELVATIGAHEHEDRDGHARKREEGYSVANDVSAQCYKKTPDGREIKVTFTGMIQFEGSKCMSVSEDGSTFVYTGEKCEIEIEATDEFNTKWPDLPASQLFGTVRSAPAAG